MEHAWGYVLRCQEALTASPELGHGRAAARMVGGGCFQEVADFFLCCSARLKGWIGKGRKWTFCGEDLAEVERCCHDDVAKYVAAWAPRGLPGPAPRDLEGSAACLEALTLVVSPQDIDAWAALASTRLVQAEATETPQSDAPGVPDARIKARHRALKTAEVVAMAALRHPDQARAQRIWKSLEGAYATTSARLEGSIYQRSPYSGTPVAVRSSVEVSLVLLVVGPFARGAWTTLGSVLLHRSCRLHVVVLGDAEGLADFAGALASLQPAIGVLMFAVRATYVNIFEDARFIALMEALPARCSRSAYGKPGRGLFGRLLVHEFLPDVDRAIVVDAGDVLFFGDVLDLWNSVDTWPIDGSIGMPMHMGFDRLQKAAWRDFGYLNAGLYILQLHNMRLHNFTGAFVLAAHAGLDAASRAGNDLFCNWEQDVLNYMASHDPAWALGTRFQVLPCEWMLFPMQSWDPDFNEPLHWPADVWERRSFPGLLSFERLVHHCPEEFETVGAWISRWPRPLPPGELAEWQYIALRHAVPWIEVWDDCPCGTTAKLAHWLATFKKWPWARRLLAAFDIVAYGVDAHNTSQGQGAGRLHWHEDAWSELDRLTAASR